MEEEKKVPKPKGGAREGAGRKPKDKVATTLVGVKIRKDFVELIDKMFPNRSEFFQKAVKNELRREGLI